jgi:RimJ/RimL family protein N-acetyltransferase
MKTILETERLCLREFTIKDSSFIIKLVNSPGWLANIGDRNIKNIEQAINYLENGPLKSYALNGFGLWMVELKDDKTPIGMCGIIKRDNLEMPDIGFAFLPEYHGKGYAFEMAKAVLNFAKEVLQLCTILAIVLPTNDSSIKLLQKIGMKFEKKFCFPNAAEELLMFRE